MTTDKGWRRMDFQIGDLIVYGGIDCVCRIMNITRLDQPGMDREKTYYVLKPLYQDCVIYTPTDNKNSLMCPVITRNDAEDLIEMIPEIKAEPLQYDDIREITEHCKSILKSRDCVKLTELTMCIYAKKQLRIKHNRKFSEQEDAFMKQAEDMLFGELSVALDIPKGQVKSYIAKRVSGQ
jgi:CarD family transcriptional regulator